NSATRCELNGAEMSATDRYLVVQIASLGTNCFGGAPNCVTGCTFTINPGSEVELRKLIAESYQTITAQLHTDTQLDGDTSYQAIPDGSSTFFAASITSGYSNEQ